MISPSRTCKNSHLKCWAQEKTAERNNKRSLKTRQGTAQGICSSRTFLPWWNHTIHSWSKTTCKIWQLLWRQECLLARFLHHSSNFMSLSGKLSLSICSQTTSWLQNRDSAKSPWKEVHRCKNIHSTQKHPLTRGLRILQDSIWKKECGHLTNLPPTTTIYPTSISLSDQSNQIMTIVTFWSLQSTISRPISPSTTRVRWPFQARLRS